MSEEHILVQFSDADICNGENKVLFDLNMQVREGDFVYIIGKVGSGKTSIIRTVIAENPLAGGTASVCGYDLGGIRERDIPYLRRKIGIVFQNFELLMDRSVEDNLEFVLQATGWKDPLMRRERIREVLGEVGLSSKAHKKPAELSGGEQQRVAIARALLNRPELIVADEPTGNLDNETAEGIMQLLTGINRERGTAVIMVTHNTALCQRFPGRIFHCEGEKCVEA
ncbi:MAG: ATP-binding cassette domain-containing protein [Bacteroidales bacterium]|nr:ATP-binding cassette domain-containing protein [Bacteroidales bacterium]